MCGSAHGCTRGDGVGTGVDSALPSARRIDAEAAALRFRQRQGGLRDHGHAPALGGHPARRELARVDARAYRRAFALIPGPWRCKFCNAPFKGPYAGTLRWIGHSPSRKSPSICAHRVEWPPEGGAIVPHRGRQRDVPARAGAGRQEVRSALGVRRVRAARRRRLAAPGRGDRERREVRGQRGRRRLQGLHRRGRRHQHAARLTARREEGEIVVVPEASATTRAARRTGGAPVSRSRAAVPEPPQSRTGARSGASRWSSPVRWKSSRTYPSGSRKKACT